MGLSGSCTLYSGSSMAPIFQTMLDAAGGFAAAALGLTPVGLLVVDGLFEC